MIKMFRFFFFRFPPFSREPNRKSNRIFELPMNQRVRDKRKPNRKSRIQKFTKRKKKFERDRKRFRALSPLISKLIDRQRSEEPTVH